MPSAAISSKRRPSSETAECRTCRRRGRRRRRSASGSSCRARRGGDARARSAAAVGSLSSADRREPGAPERLERQPALARCRVRRHRDHRPRAAAWIERGSSDRRATRAAREERGDQLERGDARQARGRRACALDLALDRANRVLGGALGERARGLPADEQLAIAHRGDARDVGRGTRHRRRTRRSDGGHRRRPRPPCASCRNRCRASYGQHDLAEALVARHPLVRRAASASGITRSTIGLTRPRASSGTTCASNARIAAIFSSSGRARSTVPKMRTRLRECEAEIELPLCARPSGRRARCARASARSADPRRRRRRRRARARLTPSGALLTASANLRRRGRCRDRGRARLRALELVGRARGADRRGAERARELDRRGADAAADGVDEQRLAALQRRPA